ncbi:hypothetical protein BDN70DRAFT_899595 [Pholiota conissans]|uniref:Uncharacterized protein n=1 Tax=Pholiota conissans TaxID=109636 RepID=A0A9P5YPQ7_9AGAR|nr:hypothetical protein BDN70DRAFT_899595 [Pholiota conissans]
MEDWKAAYDATQFITIIKTFKPSKGLSHFFQELTISISEYPFNYQQIFSFLTNAACWTTCLPLLSVTIIITRAPTDSHLPYRGIPSAERHSRSQDPRATTLIGRWRLPRALSWTLNELIGELGREGNFYQSASNLVYVDIQAGTERRRRKYLLNKEGTLG